MLLEITETVVGSVTILHLSGRLSIGDPSERLDEYVRRLIKAGCRHLLLDLTRVAYIDSSGNSKLVNTSLTLARMGGKLKLAVGEGKVREALTVTRLIEAMETFSSEEGALRAFANPLSYCVCPVCGWRTQPPADSSSAVCWDQQTCSTCNSEFTVTPDKPFRNGAILDRLRIYPRGKGGNYFEINPGPPLIIIHVVGLLDLFNWRVLEKALRSAPNPRTVLINLRNTTEVSEGGRDALLSLFAAESKSNTVAISFDGLSPEQLRFFPGVPEFLCSRKGMDLASVRSTARGSVWHVQVRD